MPKRSAAHIAVLLLAWAALASTAGAAGPFAWFSASAPPAGWSHLTLPSKGATLWFPPTLHRVPSDAVSVSAAELDVNGLYVVYLNSTPKQGDERLDNWPSYRVEHLRDESASVVHEHAHAIVAFRGGTGSCVLDDYVTRFKSHHFEEIACLVVGRTHTSVVVGSALVSKWPAARAELEQAVAAYQAR